MPLRPRQAHHSRSTPSLPTRLRRVAVTVHLWVGLAAGSVVFVVCLTGAALAFDEQLTRAFDRQLVGPPLRGEGLPLPAIAAAARRHARPDETLTSLTAPHPATSSWRATVSAGPGRPTRTLYLDATTGGVRGTDRDRSPVMRQTLALHRRLLADAPGRFVVRWATVLCCVLLVTGVFLWWPRSARGAARATTIRWRGSVVQRTYDLHNVLGFYAFGPLLLMAVTGFFFTPWSAPLRRAVTVALDGRPAPPRPQSGVPEEGRPPISVEAAAAAALRQLPTHRVRSVSIGTDARASATVRLLPPGAAYDARSDDVLLDRYSARTLRVDRWADATAAQRTLALVGPLHFGTWGGAWSQALWCLAALIGASLPVTGVLMWWRKRARRTRGVVRAASPPDHQAAAPARRRMAAAR